MSEAYRCGVCGSHDKDAFLSCNHPGCLDGRDQAFTSYASDHEPTLGALTATLFCGLLAVLVLIDLLTRWAQR